MVYHWFKMLFIFPWLLWVVNTQAQVGMEATGNWNATIGGAEVQEAGLDYTAVYTSSLDQVLLDIYLITNPNSNSNFRYNVSVSRIDINWNNALQLSIRRTGNGTGRNGNNGNGFVQGGTVFQPVTILSNLFFSGRKRREDIPVQFQISGVSVLVPVQTYSTIIVYTVTDI